MNTRLRRIWLPLGLGALVLSVVLALAPSAGAQTPGDTPATAQATPDVNATPTEEPTPGPEVRTVVSITVDPAIQPIPKGDEFEAQVSIDQVEHMAGFQFTIGYDPKRVEPVLVSRSSDGATAQQGTPIGGTGAKVVKTANLGQFLTSSGRGADEVLCSDAIGQGSTAVVTCSLLGKPVCAGGAPGVSGSGLLGSIVFKSKGGGVTRLELTESDLVLDDVAPPCPEKEEDDIIVQSIPHRRQGTTVELAKSDSNSMVLIVGIVVVAAVVVVGGGGGYLYYRGRQGGGAA